MYICFIKLKNLNMKTYNIVFLLLLTNLIILTTAITKPKTIVQSCLCDISDACDEECCCD